MRAACAPRRTWLHVVPLFEESAAHTAPDTLHCFAVGLRSQFRCVCGTAGYVRCTSSRVVPELNNGSGPHFTIARPKDEYDD